MAVRATLMCSYLCLSHNLLRRKLISKCYSSVTWKQIKRDVGVMEWDAHADRLSSGTTEGPASCTVLLKQRLENQTVGSISFGLKKVCKFHLPSQRNLRNHVIPVCLCVCLSVCEIFHKPMDRFYWNSLSLNVHLHCINFCSQPLSRWLPHPTKLKHKMITLQAILQKSSFIKLW